MGFFKKLGKSLSHSTNVIGKKITRTEHVLGKKIQQADKFGRKVGEIGRNFSNKLSDINREAQKYKGSAILASGQYAPIVSAGFETLDTATKGVSAARKNINRLQYVR